MNRDSKFRFMLASSLVLGALGAVGCSSDAQPVPVAPPANPSNIPSTPPAPVPDDSAPLPDGADIGGFPSATKCEGCHTDIYAEWKTSMHSHGATSVVTIAQTNQVLQQEFINEDDPDPQQFCTNCHGPIPALITGQATLPFADPRYSPTTLNEGITCVTCHKYDVNEVPIIGYASNSEFQENFNAGPFMFGPFGDAVDNSFHPSAQSSLLADDDDSDQLCFSCHQVGIDLNLDGDIIVGEDFVLQNLVEEYLDYEADGGDETCVSCHMPARTGQAANVTGAPVRQIRSHVFQATDYPLEEVVNGADPLKSLREEILRTAARINIDAVNFDAATNTLVDFDVSVENTGTGHNVPSAFTFMRQMWIEAQVFDPEEAFTVFDSGVLAVDSNDLCDLNTLNDNSGLSTKLVGCDDVLEQDDQLVNFQTKLVDDVDIIDGQVVEGANAREVWLQLLDGGAVNRVRPIDGQILNPIAPNEVRTFKYFVNAGADPNGTVRVRLLYRNLPPYMLRQLGEDQPPNEVQILPLISNLQITEIDFDEVQIQ